MKKFGLLMTAFLFTISLMAQDGPQKKEKDPVKMAKKRTEAMTKKLELTETQIPQVEAINLEFIQKVNALRENTERGPEQKEKIQALGNESDTKMKTVLTSVQYEKYLVMKEKKKEKLKEKKRKKGHDGTRGKSE